MALEIQILFLPQPCDLYIFGPILVWLKKKKQPTISAGRKVEGKNTDLILIGFFFFFFNSLHLFCLLSWAVGREEMEMDEAERCFLCSSLTSFVTW